MTPRPLLALFALLACGPALAQSSATPPPAPSPATPAPAAAAATPEGPLADLAWLAGCWRGSVNQREFREHWMPLRGNLMLGTGHMVNGARTQDFEYMRLEPRPDGVYYVAAPMGQKEGAFRLAGRTSDGPDTVFTFANPEHDFPQRIVYRRGSEGWLYIHVEGKLKGEDRTVIYPLRRIDCESGEMIRQ